MTSSSKRSKRSKKTAKQGATNNEDKGKAPEAQGIETNNEDKGKAPEAQGIEDHPDITYCIPDPNTKIVWDTIDKHSRTVKRAIFLGGKVKYEDGSEMDASFAAFRNDEEDEQDEAIKRFRSGQRATDHHVLTTLRFSPSYHDPDTGINFCLVAFEKFDRLFSNCPNGLEDLDPKRGVHAATVFGNPNPFIQGQTKGISAAIREMHRKEVSSSNLKLKSNYFWCAGDARLKIMADVFLDDGDLGRWESDKTRHGDDFIKEGLKHLTKHPAMEQLIKSLTSLTSSYSHKLLMISTHPFLEVNEQAIMEKFSHIYNRLRFNDKNIATLSKALASGVFNNEFMHSVDPPNLPNSPDPLNPPDPLTWDITGMDPKFNTVLTFENCQMTNYGHTSVLELLRFIRNLYEHRGPQSQCSVHVIFSDIQKKWPYLHFRLEEYL